MGLSLDDDIKMEAYFNGELNKAEEQNFLDEVAANKELQEEFEFEKFLRGKSNTIPEIEAPLIKKNGNSNPIRYLMAASIVGAVAFISVLVYNTLQKEKGATVVSQKKPVIVDSNVKNITTDTLAEIINTDKIYEKNYTYYEPTGNEPPELGKVLLAYQSHQYNKTFNELENISITRGTDTLNTGIKIYGLLYAALCFAETGKTDKAIEYFQQVIAESNNKEVKAAAKWYLALQLIKQKQPEKASATLQSIIKDNNAYSSKAAEVLNEIQ